MTLIMMAGFWFLGWFLAGYLPQSNRSLLAFPLAVGATGLAFQSAWRIGVPFSLLATVWLSLVVIAIWRWTVEHRHPNIKVRQIWKKIQNMLKGLSRFQVKFAGWPLILMAAIILFSAGIYSVWAWTVRPVTWDNLSLYETRAKLLSQDKSFREFSAEFSRSVEAQNYDFTHPFSHSFVSALFYWAGSEWTGVWVWGLLGSVILLAIRRLRDWRAAILFLLLIFGTRLSFEQMVESYASWVAGLFWLLALVEWPELDVKGGSIAPSALFAVYAASWRSAEPYWLVFATVMGAAAAAKFQSKKLSEALAFATVAFLITATVVFWKYGIATNGAWVAAPFVSEFFSEQFNPSVFLARILSFPLWGPLALSVIMFCFRRQRKKFFLADREINTLTLLWVLTGFVITMLPPYFSALSWSDISAAWPRLLLVPFFGISWLTARLAKER